MATAADATRTFDFSGSCLCKSNAFTYSGPLPSTSGITCCHCPQCRKQASIAGGGGLGVLALFTEDLEWTAGNSDETRTEYWSTPGLKARAFCKTCGTGLYSRRSDRPSILRIRVGLVDPGSGLDSFQVANHIYVPPEDLEDEAVEPGQEETPKWARLVADDGKPRWKGVEPSRV